jgi:hypothetical protein
MLAKAVGSQQEFDRAEANFQSLQQEYSQAQTDEKLAKEKLKGGSSTLEADVQNLTRLEAQERQARARVNTRIEGGDAKEPVTAAITGWGVLFSRPPVTPEVRETMAMLDKARWELEQTVVRAPTDGYVPQNVLRPGMMAVPIPIKPLMMYVVSEQPTLVASFPQKVIPNIRPEMVGEATFKQYPGRTFKVKVRRVLTAVREGELDAGGQILTPTGAEEHGHIPVVFDYDEDISDLKLPVGAQASIAIYTDRVHALSFLRKIIIRIHSWENYVF